MLSMLGGIVGDSAVQRAHREWARAPASMSGPPVAVGLRVLHEPRAAGRDLGWFWHAWLWTTESVDGSIANVATSGARTTVTVRQAGQMPSPVVLKVQFAATGPAVKPMANAKMVNDTTAIVTWPVDVWFNGSRTFEAALDFGGRAITTITLDPSCRFPDRDPGDNVWPKPAGARADGSACERCAEGRGAINSY